MARMGGIPSTMTEKASSKEIKSKQDFLELKVIRVKNKERNMTVRFTWHAKED